MNTHTLHTISKDSRIIISQHCLRRFVQRFRLFLTLTEQQSTNMQQKAIRSLIKAGEVQRKYEFSPFLMNKQMTTHHHKNMFYIKTKCGYFMMKKDGESYVAITVVRELKELTA